MRPRSPEAFRTGAASAGTSTTMTCSSGPSGSSARATARTWSRPGSRRSTASSPSWATAPCVADVGCGHGASTLIGGGLPRRASSASTTTPSRSTTRRQPPRRPASPTGCASRSLRPSSFPATGYDLVAMFDCLHDMGDPVGAAAHVPSSARARRHVDDRRAVRRRLASQDNLNPVGRVFYGASTLVSPRLSRTRKSGSRSAPGRRAAPARSRHRRWLQPIPARR